MIALKNNIVISILLIAIIFFVCSLIYEKNIAKTENNTIKILKTVNSEPIKIIPKKVFPEEKEGFKIVGKLDIPKINLSTYILEETNDDSLNVSVTKLCGPNINEVGNFCVLGHNYNKKEMFGNLKKLVKDDKVILTNMYGQKVEYIVYDIYIIKPNEVECLQQETYGNREVTLITCTTGALKRLVIKATEVYD